MSVNRVAVVDYGMGNLRSVAQAVMHAASSVDHAEVLSLIHISEPTRRS